MVGLFLSLTLSFIRLACASYSTLSANPFLSDGRRKSQVLKALLLYISCTNMYLPNQQTTFPTLLCYCGPLSFQHSVSDSAVSDRALEKAFCKLGGLG